MKIKTIIKNKNGEIIPEEKLKDIEITNKVFYSNIESINKRLKESGFDIR